MPFSKRHLTWNEEVFAGLLILVLVITGIAVWWTRHADTPTTIGTEAPSKSGTLTKEQKLEIINRSSADSESTLTEEEKLEIMKANSAESEDTLTYEEKMRILKQSQP